VAFQLRRHAGSVQPVSSHQKRGKALVKRIIKTKEVIADIRGGMNDLELTEKYEITTRGLESLLGHLVDSGLIDERELEDREQLTGSQIIRAVIASRRDRKILN
jgi:hypothetical protein